ncbi:ATP synthase gamma chain, sodium ion specific [Clostridiales bacterium CHKCI006]|uniref:ATP synthase gamma chain n=1 Tax=Candidatus Fimiplasma intestinipullorum TaxID=2840825 RepID=A0A9D1HP07_9FIRM|nr:ATP synthase gamma chain, sodium ion specific [Clostridiales bacterium CHKCI006]HIU13636.1 ATP synthase F1 subunit gamma [Candidatus Fimiplasma intestinipullorum]
MAGSMQHIKRRMRSVESTRKITHAMELVATSKLRKVRRQLDEMKPYYTLTSEVVAEILSQSDVSSHPYLKGRQNDRAALLVVDSSLGLCGGYHTNALKCALDAYHEGDLVYLLGSRGASSFPGAQRQYEDLVTSLDFMEVSHLVKELLKQYEDQEIGVIRMVYTEFVNNMTFVPHCIDLLPVQKEHVALQEAKQTSLTEFEPNAYEVLDDLIPMYLKATIYGYLIESVTSENASRRISMENATDNAGEILDELRLSYNQARQNAITNEISEIVAGSNIE